MEVKIVEKVLGSLQDAGKIGKSDGDGDNGGKKDRPQQVVSGQVAGGVHGRLRASVDGGCLHRSGDAGRQRPARGDRRQAHSSRWVKAGEDFRR